MTANRLFKFSLFIRVFVIALQVIFNKGVPDHHADAFYLPHDPETGVSNWIISFLFDGLTRWDAQYFLHISLYGYTHESTLAFFPLFPSLLHHSSKFLCFFCPSQLGIGNLHCTILAGVFVNTILTALSTVALYKLTFLVFQSKAFAFTTGLLFCLNPASIFFSALYSESLFAFFTFYGLWALEDQSILFVPLLALSSAVRSNGLMAIGYTIHSAFKSFFKKLWADTMPSSSKHQLFLGFTIVSKTTVAWMIQVAPFVIFQEYCFFLFCTTEYNPSDVPDVVIDFVTRNDLKKPSEGGKWCHWSIPFPYSYIQSRYWDVGFLNYFSIKQIPNFLLVVPIITIILSSSVKYFWTNLYYSINLGFMNIDTFERSNVYSNLKCFPYFVHMFVATIFCSLFIHIQVLTRMICSSSPLVYWVAAMAFLPTNERTRVKLLKEQSHKNSIKGSLLFLKKAFLKSSINGKIIFCYFIAYFFIGTFLHVNFFPWT